jgi:hypothetical protein
MILLYIYVDSQDPKLQGTLEEHAIAESAAVVSKPGFVNEVTQNLRCKPPPPLDVKRFFAEVHVCSIVETFVVDVQPQI